jgi:hypothetical protein
MGGADHGFGYNRDPRCPRVVVAVPIRRLPLDYRVPKPEILDIIPPSFEQRDVRFMGAHRD